MELADRAAAGHQDGLLRLQRLGKRGWSEIHDGFVASVSEIPAPPFNNVVVYADFDPAAASDALGRVAASGFPFSLQTRPAPTAAGAEIAERFDLERQAGMPLMGLSDLPAGPAVDGLMLRRLGPEEGAVHARIAAGAFDAPLELMLALTPPEVMAAEGIHFLVGELDGQPVTTAVADVNGENAWIYSVATVETQRRRGLGAAVTVAAARAAFDDGARFVFLLSSPMGVNVYEGIGFTQLEWWTSWTHPGKAA